MLLRLLALLSLSVVLPAAAAPEKPSAEPPVFWWLFLVAGENKTPLKREEAQQMQKGHIANLERLGREGKSLAAGPFGEPGPLRGIVALTVRTREEMESEFREDPFVKAGYLKLLPLRLRAPREGFGKPAEPFMLAEYRLVLYKKGPNWQAEETEPIRRDQEAHVDLIRKAQADGEIALAGPFIEGGAYRGMLLFRGKEPAAVEKLLGADPHVRSGRLTAESRLLYLPKGCVKAAE